MSDPFRHHPGLRDQIRPAEESFFRHMDLAEIDAHMVANGHPADWRTPDADREATRHRALDGHTEDDIWVFAYGSLMWDPAMIFEEVRRAHAPAFARNFCMWDDGGRGSRERPGLMLAIDHGAGCNGLAFRITRDRIEEETFVLFRREMIAEGYIPTWAMFATDHGPVEALTFRADPEAESIVRDMPIDEQAAMIAVAEGMLGTNFAYLEDMRRHLALLDVTDPYVDDLYDRVTALRAG
jgi:cation transport protein ChaC